MRGILSTILWGVATAALFPPHAGAAVAIQIGPFGGPDVVDVEITSPGVRSLSLSFVETGVPENEGMFAYELGIRLVRPAGVGAGGVRLLTGQDAFSLSPNFVFPAKPAPEVVMLQSTDNFLHVAVTSALDPPAGLADIDTGDTAGMVFFAVDPGWTPGRYFLEFDPKNTVFLSADPALPVEIPMDTTDRGVIGVPEPTGLAALALGGLLILWRRTRLN